MLPLAVLSLLLCGSSCSQTPQDEATDTARPSSRPDLYLCDGCEVATERSPEELGWRLELPPEGEPGDRLILSGQVLMPDGETPAPGVVLYIHQTNADGFYRSVLSTSGGGHDDGMIQGWLATDAAGRYEIDTVKPAPYPDAALPAHVHVYVRELERRPYYIDDFVFEGEPHVTPAYISNQELRGGSGITNLTRDSTGVWQGHRDIVLEW